MDSTRTSLPPQTELQERTVSQQRTTGYLLRFLCLLNLCSLTTGTRICIYKLNWWSSLAAVENLGTGVCALKPFVRVNHWQRATARDFSFSTLLRCPVYLFFSEIEFWCVDEHNIGTFFYFVGASDGSFNPHIPCVTANGLTDKVLPQWCVPSGVDSFAEDHAVTSGFVIFRWSPCYRRL